MSEEQEAVWGPERESLSEAERAGRHAEEDRVVDLLLAPVRADFQAAMGALSRLPDVRHDCVAALRERIARGAYPPPAAMIVEKLL